METIYEKLKDLSLDKLKELNTYIEELIFEKATKDSWNSQLKIEELEIDYELKEKLISLGINNMAEYKMAVEKGLRFSESLQEKSDFVLKVYDFDKLENQNVKKYE